MLPDLDCATLCWSCYHDTEAFDHISFADEVWAGVKSYPDFTAVAFRGSSTELDWLRDFQFLMTVDSDLGEVESGFIQGVRETLNRIDSFLDKPLVVTGHSLGAARALLFGALCAALGNAPVKITVFGSPRPAGQKVKDILAPVDIRSYRNGNDPVCAVPWTVDILLPYVHPRGLVAVDVSPAQDDQWGPFARHHSELYVTAMRNLGG